MCAAGANQRTQLLGSLEANGLKHALLLSRRSPGFELHACEAEYAGERPLRDVDVLNPIERDRSVRAVQYAAVDPDFIRTDPEFEPSPVEENSDRHEGDECQQSEESCPPPSRDGEIADGYVSAGDSSQRSAKASQQE